MEIDFDNADEEINLMLGRFGVFGRSLESLHQLAFPGPFVWDPAATFPLPAAHPGAAI